MRFLLPSLALLLLAMPPPREAAAVEVRPGRPSAAALEAARRYLCPNGGAPRRGGRCTPGRGAGLLGGSDPEVRGWDRGLAPANRTQQPCPAGTQPSMARDNPGVTRCLPV